MPARHFVTFLAAVLLSGSLVALIEVVAAGSATVWLVLAVAVSCLATAGLGWDAARPSREEQHVLRDFSDR